MATLYIVATPIGNLSDISQRALQTLKQVDCILCEDTRVSQKMLTRFGIKKPLISYHQHSKLSKTNEILEMLENGKNLALISDAGTPGISDPGGKLVEEVVKLAPRSSAEAHSKPEHSELKGYQVEVVPIPGPSAIAAIASVCGFPMDKFLFLGFPPAKKKRKQFFEKVVDSKYPVILYESCHRILKTLGEIKVALQQGLRLRLPLSQPKRSAECLQGDNLSVVVGRELTKKFETIYRGNIAEVIEKIKQTPLKGEFVVVVNK